MLEGTKVLGGVNLLKGGVNDDVVIVLRGVITA